MLPMAVVDRAAAWGAGGNSGGASDRLDMAVPEGGGAVAAATAPALRRSVAAARTKNIRSPTLKLRFPRGDLIGMSVATRGRMIWGGDLR
jgi:hypothetical protein